MIVQIAFTEESLMKKYKVKNQYQLQINSTQKNK